MTTRSSSRRDPHLGPRAAGVPDHVGQRLLHDPVAGGRRPRRAACAVGRVDVDVDLDARPTGGSRRARRGRRARAGPGAGRTGASSSSSGARRVPRVARRSSSASPLSFLMSSSVRRACSGSRSSRCAPTPAWTLIATMACATTSCTSRAIRSRSSPTRRSASSSRVRSAVSARSTSASWAARRSRTAEPSSRGAATKARFFGISAVGRGRRRGRRSRSRRRRTAPAPGRRGSWSAGRTPARGCSRRPCSGTARSGRCRPSPSRRRASPSPGPAPGTGRVPAQQHRQPTRAR